jgi:transposase, IS5 family
LETNVHFPTDVNLLWDAGRKCIELCSGLSERLGVSGWRKDRFWKKLINSQMRQVGRIKQGGGKNKGERLIKAVKTYLCRARELESKVEGSQRELTLRVVEVSDILQLEEIHYFLKMLVKHIDLVDRRLLQGEKIPHDEKLFSLFEPHTEWITKGKAWPPMELGHRLLLTTDQYQLVLDYKVMEKSVDQSETLPLARRLFENYGEQAFESMSFDKGFSNEKVREELERQVGLVVMPKKGRRNADFSAF